MTDQPTKWDAARDAQLRELWARPDLKAREVGDAMGLSLNSVRHRAESLNIRKAQPPNLRQLESRHTDIGRSGLRDRVESLAAKGVGARTIARQLDCAHSYVHRIVTLINGVSAPSDRVDDSAHVQRCLAPYVVAGVTLRGFTAGSKRVRG